MLVEPGSLMPPSGQYSSARKRQDLTKNSGEAKAFAILIAAAMKLPIALLLLAGSLFADQVTLKNGDRLTGSILKSDTKSLILKTDFAGTVTIAWDAVAAIKADGPLYIGLKDSQTLVGSVDTRDGVLEIQTQTTGELRTTKETVNFLRNKDEEAAFEEAAARLANPRLIDLWTGVVDLGYATARGNASTSTFTLAANANRVTSRDKIAVTYTSIFSSSNVAGTNVTTANSRRGGILYNLNLNRRAFVFGSMDLETDQFQALDLRFAPAGGAGYHWLTGENMKLDLSAGASGNREFFSTGLNRTSAEVLLGQELLLKLMGNSSIQEKLLFFPNVSSTGNYRINFDTTLATVVASGFPGSSP
jgi:putative salt-induced outer membrane protein YdiY